MDFNNKVVVITGGSRGIGSSIAIAFAKVNATVAIIYKENESAMRETMKIITDYGKTAKIYKCDISEYSQVNFTFQNIISNLGSIDILVNNAGIAYFGLLSSMTVSDYHNVINTNLNSAFYCSKEVIPAMVSNQSGCIINISSIWGIDGASCEVAYSAAKGGLNTFTKALAKELGPSNIRVNAIACGYINTDMNSHLSESEKIDFIEDCALGKEGSTSDVADLCLYLASEGAKYITGQIIRLDGGR